MQATLAIDDDVMAAAERAAADRAVSVDALMADVLRQALDERAGPVIARHPLSGLPYFRIPPGTAPIDLELIRQAEDEDDIADVRRAESSP